MLLLLIYVTSVSGYWKICYNVIGMWVKHATESDDEYAQVEKPFLNTSYLWLHQHHYLAKNLAGIRSWTSVLGFYFSKAEVFTFYPLQTILLIRLYYISYTRMFLYI